MADEYTPTTGYVRDAYCHVHQGVMGERGDAAHEKFHAEFDRWLAAHDREVAAKALRDAAALVFVGWSGGYVDEGVARQQFEDWLYARADRIELQASEKGAGDGEQ